VKTDAQSFSPRCDLRRQVGPRRGDDKAVSKEVLSTDEFVCVATSA
jgi:hypothetical protein